MQVDLLRRENARYKHYEEQLLRMREQLELKDELLSRLGRTQASTSGSQAAQLQAQLEEARAREEQLEGEVSGGASLPCLASACMPYSICLVQPHKWPTLA
jgi:hypothetical protein